MVEITALDDRETNTLLDANPLKQSPLSKIADALLTALDTDHGVFVVGLTESSINSLRTRMYRKNVKVLVRKVQRDGETGHVLRARTVGR